MTPLLAILIMIVVLIICELAFIFIDNPFTNFFSIIIGLSLVYGFAYQLTGSVVAAVIILFVWAIITAMLKK